MWYSDNILSTNLLTCRMHLELLLCSIILHFVSNIKCATGLMSHCDKFHNCDALLTVLSRFCHAGFLCPFSMYALTNCIKWTHNGNIVAMHLPTYFICETTEWILIKFGIDCLHQTIIIFLRMAYCTRNLYVA